MFAVAEQGGTHRGLTEQLALGGDDAESYSDDLAKKAMDLSRDEIIAKIQRDFAAAGVVETDETISRILLLPIDRRRSAASRLKRLCAQLAQSYWKMEHIGLSLGAASEHLAR